MIRSISLAALVIGSALAVCVAQAEAQEAPAKCNTTKDATACGTSGWCHWVNRKAVTLPTGQTITPPGYCAFRPGFKAAAAELAAKK